MFKSINSKKLISNTLLAGIIITGGFVIDSNQNEVQAASCDNGHGNNSGFYSNLVIGGITHTITVDGFDPSNPSGMARSHLISGLESGATFTNGMTITYVPGLSSLETWQANYVVDHLSAEESCISDETTTEPSGTITPSSFTQDTTLNKLVELERTVTLDLSALATPSGTAAPSKLDVLFLADTTGTMTSALTNVKANAQQLLTDLAATYTDLKVGVAFYRGDPSVYGESYRPWWYSGPTTYGQPGDVFALDSNPTPSTLGYGVSPENYTNTGVPIEHQAYQLIKPVNDGDIDNDGDTDIADASAAINLFWNSRLECDLSESDENCEYPEGNFFALHQAATSGAPTNSEFATGYDTKWRDNAEMKLIVLFGDAESATRTIGLTETVNALNANNIKVVSIYVDRMEGDTDHTAYNKPENAFNANEQFYSTDPNTTTITSATGGFYAEAYHDQMASTIADLIGTYAVVTTYTTPTINIDFSTVQDPNLPLGNFDDDNFTCTDPNGCIKYECIDEAGCEQVGHEEDRLFKIIFKGNIPEDYIFDTVVVDDDSGNTINGAVLNNDITIYGVD